MGGSKGLGYGDLKDVQGEDEEKESEVVGQVE